MSRVVVNDIQAKVGNDINFNNDVKINTAKIDTLKGKTTAGSITVQDVGSATCNLQEGLIKQRLYHNLVAETTKDSVNVSTVTDINTGRIGVNLTSPYKSLDEYQAHGFGNGYNGDSWGGYNTSPCKVNWAVTNTTSLYDFTNHVSSGYIDGTYMYCFSLGDLA